MSAHFSVIIPAYNAARTLPRALDSVLAQSHPAHEILVVDDASVDATPQIAAAYGERIRYLRREQNAGVSAARNHGAQQATGNWLAFLDADDWYAPGRLKLHADWIAQDGALDFLTGDYEYRDMSGALLGTSMAQHGSGRAMLSKAAGADRVVMEGDEFEAYVADHFGDTHTLSVPRLAFLELGGYPLGFKVCEDVHLLTRLVARSRRAGVICKSLGVYVIHGDSATRRDPVAAQQENVRTLTHLLRVSSDFPPAVQRGVRERMRLGRLNLGYALAKRGRRREALRAVLPSLYERPGLASVGDVLRMVRG